MDHCCDAEDTIERMTRQWERSEQQLIEQIRKLQDQLEAANLEIARWQHDSLTGLLNGQ